MYKIFPFVLLSLLVHSRKSALGRSFIPQRDLCSLHTYLHRYISTYLHAHVRLRPYSSPFSSAYFSSILDVFIYRSYLTQISHIFTKKWMLALLSPPYVTPLELNNRQFPICTFCNISFRISPLVFLRSLSVT